MQYIESTRTSVRTSDSARVGLEQGQQTARSCWQRRSRSDFANYFDTISTGFRQDFGQRAGTRNDPPLGRAVQQNYKLRKLGRNDFHVDRELHIAVQPDRHLVGAQDLQGLGQIHLAAFQRDTGLLGNRVSNFGSTDGTEQPLTM